MLKYDVCNYDIYDRAKTNVAISTEVASNRMSIKVTWRGVMMTYFLRYKYIWPLLLTLDRRSGFWLHC